MSRCVALLRSVWLASLLAACAPLAPQGGYAWLPSPNFGERRPDYVVIHQTDSASYERAQSILTDPASGVSAHYLVSAEGKVLQLVDEKYRAWHAGHSWWGGLSDLNSASIGIELDHYGDDDFPEVQIQALLDLLKDISARHAIPPANYLAHGDVAPGRKQDPNFRFPWRRLAAAGYGLWCDADEAMSYPLSEDPVLALRALGYDTTRPDFAIAAFLRHYRGKPAGRVLDEEDRKVLACLLAKK